MRREDLAPGNFYHVVIRGAGGFSFLHDDDDWLTSLTHLYYINDSTLRSTWRRELQSYKCGLFERPQTWPAYDPRVHIFAFCIHDNHIHLLIEEMKEGGLTSFMRRYPNCLSNIHRIKYGKAGSIFQAGYQLRRIDSDADLRNVALYILSKNVFERYPEGGIEGALKNFHRATNWALKDPFSAFADYGSTRDSPLVHREILGDFFRTPASFIKEAEDYLSHRIEREKEIRELLLE